MADADLRALERRWHEDGSVEAARDFVAARLRLGALGSTGSPGSLRVDEEMFLEGLARRDPVLTRSGLSGLDVAGQPDGDRWAPPLLRGVVLSPRAAPSCLRWPPAEDTLGTRLVAGWLETLSREARLTLWTLDILSEPAVTDDERRAVFAAATGLYSASWDAMLVELDAVARPRSLALCYLSGTCLEGAPPTIARSTPALVHGLLRCGLVRHAAVSDADVSEVVCAVLERPECHEPSRPEIQIAAKQLAPFWGSPGFDTWAVEEARRQLRDSYALRGALVATAAIPSVLRRPRVLNSLQGLVASVAKEPVAYALSALGPVRDALPVALARDLRLSG